MYGDLIAPQYGIHCPRPPKTDNPACADLAAPMPADIRARLRTLRNEAKVRYVTLQKTTPRGLFV